MAKTPIFGQFGKGDPDTEIDGNVIDNIPAESMADEARARLLPDGGNAGDVLERTANDGRAWGPVPVPNIDGLINFIEPNKLLFDETVVFDAGDTNKHKVLDHFLPQSGEVTVVLHPGQTLSLIHI